MFERGEAVVHPTRGVGIVVDIEERSWQGDESLYYKIELLGREPDVSIRIPVEKADGLGVRRAISASEVKQIWDVLRSEPESLPSNHKTRYKVLKDKLHAGDVLKVAEILRDLTWRREDKDHLTTRVKRVYEEGLMFLAGEIAAAQDIPLTEAMAQVRSKLKAILPAKSAA
jgi:CarD family transcriptional regulator